MPNACLCAAVVACAYLASAASIMALCSRSASACTALRRPDCTAFVAALTAKPLAPSTVHTVYAVLRSLMQSAVQDQLIPANPCSRVPLPRLDKRVVVPLPADAVSALAAAMPARYELAVWLAAGAGLREGEALGLTVPRVEFLARRLAVVEQMQNKVLSR